MAQADRSLPQSKGLESVRAFIKAEFEKIRKPVPTRQIEMACLIRDETPYTKKHAERFAVKSKRLANQAILRVPLHRKRPHTWYVGDINRQPTFEQLMRELERYGT